MSFIEVLVDTMEGCYECGVIKIILVKYIKVFTVFYFINYVSRLGCSIRILVLVYKK